MLEKLVQLLGDAQSLDHEYNLFYEGVPTSSKKDIISSMEPTLAKMEKMYPITASPKFVEKFDIMRKSLHNALYIEGKRMTAV